jgi:hypothetical protein
LVFLSRDLTMRTDEDPRGDRNRRSVRVGDKQAGRSAILIVLAFARKLGWILEQPGSSTLLRHPALLWTQNQAINLGFMWHVVETYMWHFHAPHCKRTILASNESCTHNLARSHPGAKNTKKSGIKKTATTSVRADGKKEVTGDSTGVLKGTQEYTDAFGAAVASSVVEFRDFFSDLDCTGGQIIEKMNFADAQPWDDCDLKPVYDVLNRKHRVYM